MLQEFEKPVTAWLQQMGWRENPFTLKILPSVFVGYREQLRQLTQHIKEGHKVAMVTGSTGSGKTTLLMLFKSELSAEYDIIYLSKPPRVEEIIEVFVERLKPGFFEKLFGFKVTLHSLPDYVAKKSKGRKLLILVDEGHEAEIEALEWMRTLTDQMDNVQLVLAGLPTLDSVLRKNLETLRSRVSTTIELVSLSESETFELVRKRIESVGGSGLGPFNEDVLRQVYSQTGGFPREILKACDRLVEQAIRENKTAIEKVELPVIKAMEMPKTRDFLRDLPPKQRAILELLAKEGGMYPSEVADKVGLEEYATKQHAVRSMNNILKRLMDDGFLDREARGKGFVYTLNAKTKSLLVEA